MKIIFTEKHGKPQLPENGYFFCILKINKNKLNLNKKEANSRLYSL